MQLATLPWASKGTPPVPAPIPPVPAPSFVEPLAPAAAGTRAARPVDRIAALALLAVAILAQLGITPEQARAGLREARVPGRLEPVDAGQDFLALVDYAHKPGALRAVLETLRRAPNTRRIAVVFGAGGNRDAGKRAPMGAVAAELADLVVVTDDNPRDEDPAAIRAAVLGGAAGPAQTVEIGDRRAAIDHAVAWAGPGDVVLIAGKGHEDYQDIGGVRHPFSDIEHAQRVLQRLAAQSAQEPQ